MEKKPLMLMVKDVFPAQPLLCPHMEVKAVSEVSATVNLQAGEVTVG